jgi:MFS family permease
MKKILTRNILLLGIISLLTDVSSEMLFPLIPLFLDAAGYGIIAIASVEAIAQITTGGAKFFFGHFSDRMKKRKVFVQLGYIVAAIAKPVMALSPSLNTVSSMRFLDRMGKGIRTAPRDAILTSETSHSDRGTVFGFHRGMDTLGACIGPAIAILAMSFGWSTTHIFYIAIIPSIIAIVATFFINEKKSIVTSHDADDTRQSADNKVLDTSTHYQKTMEALVCAPNDSECISRKEAFSNIGRLTFSTSKKFKGLSLYFLFTAFIATSATFLILSAKRSGMSDTFILMAYMIFNIIYALASFLLGKLSDRIGYAKVYLIGITGLAWAFLLLALNSIYPIGHIGFMAIFSLYGLFIGIDDAISKAWISTYTNDQVAGHNLGLQSLCVSIGSFLGILCMGYFWSIEQRQVAYMIFSCLAGIATIICLVLIEKERTKSQASK